MVQEAVGNVSIINLVQMKTNYYLTLKLMKTKNLFLIFLFVTSFSYAQIAIGKSNITNNNNGISLEFGIGNKGIILPWATNSATVALSPIANNKGGAFILDVSDKKVKISKNNGTWIDLTIHSTEKPAIGGNANIDNALQTNAAYPEKASAKVMIGGNPSTDNTPGILVLADTNKAMIPPLVSDPANNIKNPAPGMMVYDPIKKLFAVYNGTIWSYWRQPG